MTGQNNGIRRPHLPPSAEFRSGVSWVALAAPRATERQVAANGGSARPGRTARRDPADADISEQGTRVAGRRTAEVRR